MDDIISLFTFLDESQQLHKMPLFVATSPDRMPSMKLLEGDLSFVLAKLTSLEEKMLLITANQEHCLELMNIHGVAIQGFNTGGIEQLLKEHIATVANSLSTKVSNMSNITLDNDNAVLHTQDNERIIGREISRIRQHTHWGSEASADELESDKGVYTDVTTRNTRKLAKAKRKEISPLSNNEDTHGNMLTSNRPSKMRSYAGVTSTEAPRQDLRYR